MKILSNDQFPTAVLMPVKTLLHNARGVAYGQKKTMKKVKTGQTKKRTRGDTRLVSSDAPPSIDRRRYRIGLDMTLDPSYPEFEQEAARFKEYIKWATEQIEASRTRSKRISKRIERLSRETDAVLARLEAAG